MALQIEKTQKGFHLVFISRLKEEGKLNYAINIQDKLRKKSKGWSGATEIRKWRDKEGCRGEIKKLS